MTSSANGPDSGASRPPDRPQTRLDAQRRANRIRAFQAELDTLARDGVLVLTPAQQADVARHHDAQLASLRQTFDVDSSDAASQMSRGMQVAALLGSMAFSAAVFSFFYHYWGLLSTPAQVAIVTLIPIVLLLGVEYAARRERTHYVASLLALVACAAVVLEVIALGAIFNMQSSPGGLLAWAAFALAVGYGYGFRLPFAAGLLCLIVYLTAAFVSARGYDWGQLWRFNELTMVFAFGALALSWPHARLLAPWRAALLAAPLRIVSLSIGLLMLLMLSLSSSMTLLPFSPRLVSQGYQVLAVVLAGLTIAAGIRRGWQDTYVIGVLFLLVFLLTRFVDWWWDWMPKYLFFLLIGALTLGILVVLRRARQTLITRGLS